MKCNYVVILVILRVFFSFFSHKCVKMSKGNVGIIYSSSVQLWLISSVDNGGMIGNAVT